MARSITKAELLDTVASSAGCSKTEAESVLGAFFDTVQTETKAGNKVGWPGFGAFSTSQRAARTGRNPQTGAPVKIAASTAMKFAASSTLKEALNSKKAAAKKTAAKKTAAKKTTARKAATKKAPAKKAAAKKR